MIDLFHVKGNVGLKIKKMEIGIRRMEWNAKYNLNCTECVICLIFTKVKCFL
jgi:hypothetical protein